MSRVSEAVQKLRANDCPYGWCHSVALGKALRSRIEWYSLFDPSVFRYQLPKRCSELMFHVLKCGKPALDGFFGSVVFLYTW